MDSLPDTSNEHGGTRAKPAASGMLTETLARLYWRQGLHATALDIYRRLAQAQPVNQRLQEQIARLEHHMAAAAFGSGHARRVQAERVIVHLERWLRHLRGQRGLRV